MAEFLAGCKSRGHVHGGQCSCTLISVSVGFLPRSQAWCLVQYLDPLALYRNLNAGDLTDLPARYVPLGTRGSPQTPVYQLSPHVAFPLDLFLKNVRAIGPDNNI